MKEDLLFKVLFDKLYRPKVYEYVTELNTYKQPKIECSTNVEDEME